MQVRAHGHASEHQNQLERGGDRHLSWQSPVRLPTGSRETGGDHKVTEADVVREALIEWGAAVFQQCLQL